MTADLSTLEFDLLNHLVHGTDTHADGKPMVYGAWMMECVESLRGKGYVKMERHDGRKCYFATEAGEQLASGGSIQ